MIVLKQRGARLHPSVMSADTSLTQASSDPCSWEDIGHAIARAVSRQFPITEDRVQYQDNVVFMTTDSDSRQVFSPSTSVLRC
jgi:ethanolamine utilization protein EutA (predicted chaperonin)